MCTFSRKTERPKGRMLPVVCHFAQWYLPCRDYQLGYSLQPQVPQYSAHASPCHCCAVWMPRANWVNSSGNVSRQWFKLGLSLEEAVKEIVHFGSMQDMYLGSATYWLSFSFFFCKMGWWESYTVYIMPSKERAWKLDIKLWLVQVCYYKASVGIPWETLTLSAHGAVVHISTRWWMLCPEGRCLQPEVSSELETFLKPTTSLSDHIQPLSRKSEPMPINPQLMYKVSYILLGGQKFVHWHQLS